MLFFRALFSDFPFMLLDMSLNMSFSKGDLESMQLTLTYDLEVTVNCIDSEGQCRSTALISRSMQVKCIDFNVKAIDF